MKKKYRLHQQMAKFLLILFGLLFSTIISAKPTVVTDILGRKVTVNTPIKKSF